MRITMVVLLALGIPAVAQARVYTESNAAEGNEVLVFDRGGDGHLALTAHVATGGNGAGAGLGSQAALALSDDGQFLFAVNAGSNDVSVFVVTRHGLRLAGRTATGGEEPISVAVHGHLVYVLDAGGDGDVSGFRLAGDGTLTPLGIRPLANVAPSPAQVAFAPLGELLVVTEKATNCIDTFAIDHAGRAGTATCHPSAGQTPFGFAFAPPEWDWFGNRYERLVVSEAAGGAAGATTVSSYVLVGESLDAATPAVRTTQTAACWVVLARDGRDAYVTNTGSGTVSAFRVHADGALRLLSSDGVSGETGVGSKPSDVAAADGYVDVVDSGTHALSTFAVRADGRLTAVASTSGLPPFAAGLVER